MKKRELGGGKIVQIQTKVGELIPNNIKEIGNNINAGPTETELYNYTNNILNKNV